MPQDVFSSLSRLCCYRAGDRGRNLTIQVSGGSCAVSCNWCVATSTAELVVGTNTFLNTAATKINNLEIACTENRPQVLLSNLVCKGRLLQRYTAVELEGFGQHSLRLDSCTDVG